MVEPSYLGLYRSGEFAQRVKQAYERLDHCDICAWQCHVNRSSGQLGKCKTGIRARVASWGPHYGEERPLSGWRGSGTIFFSRCNLRCVYCQNFDISQSDAGEEIEPEDLATIMLRLQNYGCHNINFVSPSHVVPQIMAAVLIAAAAGLSIPLVYNTGGYDSLKTLSALDGIIDIYMPDMKYADAEIARKYSGIPDYPQVNRAAVKEMHRQVGDLLLDDNGLAERGLLVRHLILPNDLAGTDVIIEFLANEVSKQTYLNLMTQYRPEYQASVYPELTRRITRQEYEAAVMKAQRLGLCRLD